MQIQSKKPGHSMIYKRCSELMVRSYSFFHEWLENLRTILLQVRNNEQFEEKCHFLAPFRMVFVAKQAHVRKIIVDLFRGKRKKNYLPHTKVYTFICKICLTVYCASYKTTKTRLWKTLIYLRKFNPNKNADVHSDSSRRTFSYNHTGHSYATYWLS